MDQIDENLTKNKSLSALDFTHDIFVELTIASFCLCATHLLSFAGYNPSFWDTDYVRNTFSINIEYNTAKQVNNCSKYSIFCGFYPKLVSVADSLETFTEFV